MNRREWLKSASALTLAAVAAMVLGPAVEAGINNPGSASSVTPGFNGGRTQINQDFVAFTGTFPFINNFLANQGWTTISPGASVDASTLDANGYPTSIVNGGITTLFFIPTQAEYAGDYTLTFNSASNGATVVIPGVGTFVASGTGLQSFNVTGSTLNGLNQTNWSYNGFRTICRVQLNITTTGVSNIHFFNVNDTAAHSAALANGLTWGGFGQQFLSTLKAAKPGVLRFLNWQGPDQTIAKWANRRPTTYSTFGSYSYPPTLACGSTAGSGDTFTITGNGTGVPATGAPTDKLTMIINLDHSGLSTANTLSLNGTTAVPFYTLGTSTVPLQVTAGRVTVIYDAVLNVWMTDTSGNAGVLDGCPPEVCARLAFEVGAHPYFVTPYLSFAPLTDYMTSLASYIKSTYQDTGLANWMIPRFEGPNEQWNSFSQNAANYSVAVAIKWWGLSDGGASNGDNYWYGYGQSLMGQAINAVWGSPNPKTQTKYQQLCGVQSVTYQPGTSFSSPRLNSARIPGFLTAAFAGGSSANITVTGNTYSANDPITFATSGTLPTGITYNTVYFVKTTGATITISATPGGTALTFASAGSGTIVIIRASQSPGYNWATTVCCTNYINPASTSGSELPLAYAYSVTNLGNSSAQATNLVNYLATNDVQFFSGNITISGTALTVNSTVSGAILPGVINGVLVGAGIAYNTKVVSGSGTSFVVDTSQNVGPVNATQEGLLASYQAWQLWGSGMPNPVSKLCNYEGGWSPDYAPSVGADTTINVLSASNTNPCVLTVATKTCNYLGGGASSTNINPYPANSWLQLDFTAAGWSTIAGTYKVTASTDTTITVALNASGQAAPTSSFADPAKLFFNVSTATVSIVAATGVMTVTGWSGDPILSGATIFWASAPFGGNNGFPKVISGITGTGGNGTYNVSYSGGDISGQAVTFLFEPWFMVNMLRYNSKFASGLNAMLKQNYTDVITNTTNGEFPSCFAFGNVGIWGIADPDIYSLGASPQYQAIVQFNS